MMLIWSSPLAKHDNKIGSRRRVETFLDAVSNRAGSVTIIAEEESNKMENQMIMYA